MKLVYSNMGHILCFGEGYANELVVENKRLFLEMVESIISQSEGASGNFVLSKNDKPIEISKNIDITIQFAPFEVNRKSLLTKLCAAIEARAMLAENYTKTAELLTAIEGFAHQMSDELSVEIDCEKIAIGPIIKAISPVVEMEDKTPLEKIFSYMELVRELDRDRLFIMVNMRTYFSDCDIESFIETVTLHDFKLLMLESSSFPPLKRVKRYTIDDDLCEF